MYSLEYEQLAVALKNVLEADPAAFNADRLAAITADTLAGWFAPHALPQVEERVQKLREVSSAICQVLLTLGTPFVIYLTCRILDDAFGRIPRLGASSSLAPFPRLCICIPSSSRRPLTYSSSRI